MYKIVLTVYGSHYWDDAYLEEVEISSFDNIESACAEFELIISKVKSNILPINNIFDDFLGKFKPEKYKDYKELKTREEPVLDYLLMFLSITEASTGDEKVTTRFTYSYLDSNFYNFRKIKRLKNTPKNVQKKINKVVNKGYSDQTKSAPPPIDSQSNINPKTYKFPFSELVVTHLDSYSGVIISPDKYRPLHFKVRFNDGSIGSHTVDKLFCDGVPLGNLISEKNLSLEAWLTLIRKFEFGSNKKQIVNNQDAKNKEKQKNKNLKNKGTEKAISSPPYKRINLVQGSKDWHEWRFEGIGASDAPALMGESPWKSPESLLVEKKTKQSNFKGNKFTRMGHELEPVARQLYEQTFGVSVQPACLEHLKYAFLRASVDGISDLGDLVVEIKCGKKIYEYVSKKHEVPKYITPQLQHILAVTGLPFIDFWSYWVNSEPVHIRVYRDEQYIKTLIQEEVRFWKKVEGYRVEFKEINETIVQPVHIKPEMIIEIQSDNNFDKTQQNAADQPTTSYGLAVFYLAFMSFLAIMFFEKDFFFSLVIFCVGIVGAYLGSKSGG